MIETRNFRILRNIVLTVLSLWVAIPLFVVVSTSLKPLKDVSGLFQWIPREITLSPYVDIWTTVPLAKYFQNSLIITVCATVCSVTVAVLAAYAIARLPFKGKRAFSLTVLSTQMFPGILFLLPLYLIFTQIRNMTGLQLQGSYLGLIITYMTFTLPFAIWMLSGYFASIPKELEEASMIDGTGRMGALFRVILPVAKPGIIAVAVYSFISAWGEVLFASVLTNEATKTLSLGLKAYASESDVFWNQLMAASVVVSLPVLIGFILVQKHLVAGLSSGAVK
ncbi:carbohydrate ABC transporter permease [Paenarthrobacter sp. NPDC089322]|uniref:carbohydrate ABC transporter permease n=1 Tax=Paenarthrobacter sp. NPDC089322 TaxID=3155065 RepID=UPI003422109D